MVGRGGGGRVIQRARDDHRQQGVHMPGASGMAACLLACWPLTLSSETGSSADAVRRRSVVVVGGSWSGMVGRLHVSVSVAHGSVKEDTARAAAAAMRPSFTVPAADGKEEAGKRHEIERSSLTHCLPGHGPSRSITHTMKVRGNGTPGLCGLSGCGAV